MNDLDDRRAIVVCGPTASGKSGLADAVSGGHGTSAILVDSMQVYREIPVITNQFRSREARLAGIVSVSEEWSVADHVSAVECEIPGLGSDTVVFDAGTGMYLNAVITNIPLAPRVHERVRREATRLTEGGSNPRRASRAKELELSGEGDTRGSIWGCGLVRYTTVVYIRPDIETLEAGIRERSRRIMALGVPEAETVSVMLRDGRPMSASVLEAIGVKELLSHVSGDIGEPEAEERMNIRTRRLAKRQIRWFDKLARTLEPQAEPPGKLSGMHVVESAADGEQKLYA